MVSGRPSSRDFLLLKLRGYLGKPAAHFPEPLQARVENNPFFVTTPHKFPKGDFTTPPQGTDSTPFHHSGLIRICTEGLARFHTLKAPPYHSPDRQRQTREARMCFSPVSRCRRAPPLGVWAGRALRMRRKLETHSCEFPYH